MTSAAVPTGIVTMLFCDVEESTRLLSGLGAETYTDVLIAQRRLLREAFVRWHGHEMGTEGDSFFVAFGSARDAVNACLEAQRGLTAYDWPGGAQVRVRMGLHSGEAEPHEDGYVGLDVHLAARVAAAAHGGQVVVSGVTRHLAGSQLAGGASLSPLGAYRLKDIAEAQELFQLMAPGLPERFPPLRTIGTSANLPAPAGALIGRDQELGELVELVSRSDVRLHTLTGPGGCGKTRLAVAVAEAVAPNYSEGVYFVPLAAVTEASAMWTTMAEVVGLAGASNPPSILLESLAHRRVLLVLDNLEQLPDAGASIVQELLAAAPGVGVLATSRRPLHVVGEQEYAVGMLTEACAVAMFVDRARLVRSTFRLSGDNTGAVGELCRRLDGLPLALELAAARLKLLGPQALLDRLGSNLDVGAMGSTRPDRHQTLRATVAWSYDLLHPELQAAFRQLGVFADGAELDAVTAVTGVVDGLHLAAALVDASLVIVDDGPYGSPRLRMLETMRRFALEKLAEKGELEATRRRHTEHYLALAQAAAKALRGPGMVTARATLQTELANLRESLAWSLDADAAAGSDTERLALGLRLCGALSFYWYSCGYVAEGRDWTQRASALAAADQGQEFAVVLHTLGILLIQQGDPRNARDILAKCLRIWQRLGDQSRVAIELNSLAVAHRNLGDFERARQLMEQSVATARGIDDRPRLATALSNLGMFEVDQGNAARALEALTEAEAVDLELGDTWGVVTDRVNRVAALVTADRVSEGLALLRSFAPEAAALGDDDMTFSVLELFAICWAQSGEASLAARLVGAAQSLRQQANLPTPDPDLAFFERHLTPAREAMGENAWTAGQQAGRGLTAAEALDLALADEP